MNIKQKLIRDKIGDLIRIKEQNCQVKILSDQEYRQALQEKLLEEAQEVVDAEQDQDLMAEIADVYEVMEALIKAHNLDPDEIEQIKQDKVKSKGKFEQKIKLIAVKENQSEQLSSKINPILLAAEDFLRKEVEPQADAIDRNDHRLRQILMMMNDRDQRFFCLKLAQQWGGLGLDNFNYYSWQIMMAQYSGALAFLQTQHQSAVALLNNSPRKMVKEKYLTALIPEKIFFGVGFSHLRKKGEPLVKAIPFGDGYRLNGNIPWITGYGIFNYFILGASLPTGEELYGVLPFQSSTNNCFQISPPISLGVMNSSNTVCAVVHNYFLPHEDVVMIKPPHSIHDRDQKNVLHHGFFPLGCSYGALKILRDNHQINNLSAVDEVYQGLKFQVDALKEQMLATTKQNIAFREKLNLRAKAIDLAHRCAMAALVSSKGKANFQDHPANRFYREALVYSVSGQTEAVMLKSLQNLV